MINSEQKLGAFIVPTGVAASIGGFAGDASYWARKFAKVSKLIVNPNVVNAACFSGITENMLYVEGYSLDEFFKGKINLLPNNELNKVGVIFDRGISQEVLNIHINTINAVKTVYGIDVIYEQTPAAVDVEFFVDENGISTGKVNNIENLLATGKSLLAKGSQALAIVCNFGEDESDEDYENGFGVDPVGGVEAIISHYISKNLKVPAAHAPAFSDVTISSKLVNPKASAEYITPTFLPCILLGLSQAPLITCQNIANTITVKNLDYVVMPYNSLGSIPVFESINRNIKVFAIKENRTVLNVTKENLVLNNVTEVETYAQCLQEIIRM